MHLIYTSNLFFVDFKIRQKDNYHLKELHYEFIVF